MKFVFSLLILLIFLSTAQAVRYDRCPDGRLPKGVTFDVWWLPAHPGAPVGARSMVDYRICSTRKDALSYITDLELVAGKDHGFQRFLDICASPRDPPGKCMQQIQRTGCLSGQYYFTFPVHKEFTENSEVRVHEGSYQTSRLCVVN